AALAAPVVLRGPVRGAGRHGHARDRRRHPDARGGRARARCRGGGRGGHLEGGLRRAARAHAGAADVHHRFPDRAVPAGPAQARQSAAGGSLRALCRPSGAGQRLQRAQRPDRSARALQGAGDDAGARRRRGALARRGLRASAGVRHAAHRRRGDRHRSPGDTAGRPALHPRGDPLPPPAAGDPRRVSRGLPYELFLGLRYLGSRGKRANLSLFVWIGVGGVFLGVAALIIVLAVMTGFQDGIRDRILSANPHLLIFQSGGSGMMEADRVASRVRDVPGVRAATPFVLQQALFTSPGGEAHGGLVRGVDASDPTVLGDLQGQLRSGRMEGFADGQGAILLGAELARVLGLLPGDFVTVISPKGALTAVGMVPKMRRYVVAGTIEAGMHEYDSSIAYLPLAAARDFSGLPGVTGVEVKLTDPFQARAIGRTLAGRLGFPYWVRDWMEMNRNLFAAL